MHPTLVLDLDGTLVDSVPDLAAALNRMLAPRGLAPFTLPEVTAMVGDGARALVERAFAARQAAFDPAGLDAFLADYTAHAAEQTRPYPGVEAALAAMAAQGWRFAVCTNKPERAARALLDALGLAHRFVAVGGGDSFPSRKPDPAHLLATLAAAGGVVTQAVMVGDHHNDVRAAAGAGVACIFAGWGYGPASMAAGAAIAASFADVPALAGRLVEQQQGSALHPEGDSRPLHPCI